MCTKRFILYIGTWYLHIIIHRKIFLRKSDTKLKVCFVIIKCIIYPAKIKRKRQIE